VGDLLDTAIQMFRLILVELAHVVERSLKLTHVARRSMKLASEKHLRMHLKR
jgi:hypothetical protein